MIAESADLSGAIGAIVSRCQTRSNVLAAQRLLGGEVLANVLDALPQSMAGLEKVTGRTFGDDPAYAGLAPAGSCAIVLNGTFHLLTGARTASGERDRAATRTAAEQMAAAHLRYHLDPSGRRGQR